MFTTKGLLAKSIVGFGFSKLSEGGICPCCSASAVLIRLTTPAAVSRCPMFDFTEPIRQKPFLSVERRKASVRAAISIGSPM